ncbi:hypothetical protein PR048_029883 [Dryococelus australis]|uniref:Uncharacterized protein n=1 Tax=Dryococelus australis TaxID=614101 RepID=A0ABQ9G8A2_9NEOP|nr:hypothetical protein PR048_029883 [Dryococelus australis]
MGQVIPAALKYALEEDVELRRGLPRDYLRYMGSVHSDQKLPERQAFVERLHGLLDRMFQHLPVDAATDQLGKQYAHDALPPVLTTGTALLPSPFCCSIPPHLARIKVCEVKLLSSKLADDKPIPGMEKVLSFKLACA